MSSDTEPPREAGNHSPLPAIWIAALLIGVAIVGFSVWKQQRAARLRTLLPPIPKGESWPAAFSFALQDAEYQALSLTASDRGVAELGRLYQANNFLPQAEVCWRRLLQRRPTDGHWDYYLADIARTSGDDEGMAAWLRRTVERAPAYSPAWLKLAEWEFKTGQVDEAERSYRRRLALKPGDPYARLGLARIASGREQREEARSQIESLVHDHPAFYPAHNLFAEILEQRGEASEARQERARGRAALRFREADDPWLDELQSRCFDVERIAVWASIELTTNHGDHGLALLTRAIQIAPKEPIPYVDLGQLFLQLKNPAAARDRFEQAIALPKAPTDAFAGLSEAERALNRPDQAANAARQGLRRMPNDANLETALGNALRDDGKIDEAIAAFHQATVHAPSVAETSYNYGSALLLRGRTQEAEAALKQAVAIKGAYAPALTALVRLYLSSGRANEAESYVNALSALDRPSNEARQVMGLWCLKQGAAAAETGRTKDAEGLLRRGIEVCPDLAELPARLGLLLGQEGRYAESIPPLETYRHLQPAEPLASLFLGQAYANAGRPADARRLLTEGRDLAQQSGQPNVVNVCMHLLQNLPH